VPISAADALAELKACRKARGLRAFERLGGSHDPPVLFPSWVFKALGTESPSEKELDWLEQRLQERAADEAVPQSNHSLHDWIVRELPEWNKTVASLNVPEDDVRQTEKGSDASEQNAQTKSLPNAEKASAPSPKKQTNSKSLSNAEGKGRRRASLVAQLIAELKALRPQMQVPEEDYPRLCKQNPKYKVFKICKKHPGASVLVQQVCDRRNVNQLAYKLAGMECSVSAATIETAWKHYKRKLGQGKVTKEIL